MAPQETFADVNVPALGGTLTLLLDGSEAPSLNKPDNMAIDTEGNVLIQEDPGGNAHLARILAYRIEDGAIGVLAQFDAAQFSAALAAPTAFITEDEESSGIIDISRLTNKESTFLFDAEVHKASADPALVEQGPLLTMTVDEQDRVYEARNDDSENGHDGEDQGNHGGQDDRQGYSIGLWGDMPYTATGPGRAPERDQRHQQAGTRVHRVRRRHQGRLERAMRPGAIRPGAGHVLGGQVGDDLHARRQRVDGLRPPEQRPLRSQRAARADPHDVLLGQQVTGTGST